MADLGVPDALADGAKTAEELAAAIEVDVILLRRLLRMLSSRGALLVDERSRFSNSGLSASLRSGGTRDMVLGWTAAPSIFDAWSHISDGIRSATSPFERAHGVPFHDYLVAVLSACRVAGLPSVRVHVVEMPAHEDAQHPSATNDMTAWTVYGGADRTLAEWTALHARAGLAISDVTQLDDVYALMTSAPMIPARR